MASKKTIVVFSIRRRDTRFLNVTGVKECALPSNISGFIYYMTSLPEGWPTNGIMLMSSVDALEKAGITDEGGFDIRNIHYQLSQWWRINPGCSVYVGLYAKTSSASYDFKEIIKLQNYAGGDIRQVGVWSGNRTLSATDLTTLQGVATKLASDDQPCSIIYAPKVEQVASLPTNLARSNPMNASVLIGHDVAEVALPDNIVSFP